MCTLAGQLSAATCRWLLLIGELDRRKAYEHRGCASMAQWLSWKCAPVWSRAVNTRELRRALTRELPVICDRFGVGVLSYSKVRALVRIATPATEAKLVEFAEVATAAQLERTIRTYERVSVNRDTAAAQVAARRVTVHHDDDGMVTIVARCRANTAERPLAR